MITIKEGELNRFMIRANDNISGTGSIYLFEFECVQSREKFYFTPQNNSTNSRYMDFQVQEITGTTFSYAPTASIPQIYLTYGGQYNYKVYQQIDYSLTPDNYKVVIDHGKGIFYNGEYQDFFFFELDENYVLYGYVLDDYTIRGNTDYIFDISNSISRFDFDDATSNRVFVESSITNKWEWDESVVYSIFDDEALARILTTEADEDLVCEDGSTVLLW